jgi:hypothetical protein
MILEYITFWFSIFCLVVYTNTVNQQLIAEVFNKYHTIVVQDIHKYTYVIL